MDLLTIERVWEDEYFFEIRVVAQSKVISAECRSYTTEDAINELSSKLITFPSKPNDSFLWENGLKGDQSTPYLSLEFMCEDKLGHILVEVYMEIDDGALYSKHNCCFYVRTEIGRCNKFGKALEAFNTTRTVDVNHVRLFCKISLHMMLIYLHRYVMIVLANQRGAES